MIPGAQDKMPTLRPIPLLPCAVPVRRLINAALLGAALCAGGPAARADEGPWVSVQGADVRLLGGAVKDGVVEAGLEVRLADGWKTYWRYPGDSGVPPRADWSASQNVAGVEMAWPAPRRFADGGGGFSIGYKRSVVFPLKVRLADPAQPGRLQVSFDFAVCEKLCVPAHAEATLPLPGGGKASAALEEARARLPKPAEMGGAGTPAVLSATLDTTVTPPVLAVEARVASRKADLFLEGPSDAWALPLPARAEPVDGKVRFTVPLLGVPPGATLAGTTLTATLVDGPAATQTAIPLPEPSAPR